MPSLPSPIARQHSRFQVSGHNGMDLWSTSLISCVLNRLLVTPRLRFTARRAFEVASTSDRE